MPGTDFTLHPGYVDKSRNVYDDKTRRQPESRIRKVGGFMKKNGFVMKMKKHSSFGVMAVMLISCLILMGCSDGMSQPVRDQPASEIPPDLRNTAWTRQVNDSETVTISFGRGMMTMSSNRNSSQYDQDWNYRGANCCGYGYCGFYNGQDSLEFRYSCNGNRLSINSSSVRALNGNWTRK